MNKIYNNLNIENLIKTDWINQFDRFQQKELLTGLEKQIDVSIYAKPEYNYRQMKQMLLGLEENLDVSQYAKVEYSWVKMKEIREKLENGQNT